MWNSKQISEALGINFSENITGKRVVIDSRKIEAGDIFVGIKGDNFDGSDYGNQAIEKGAAAAIINKTSCLNSASENKFIRVDDALAALVKLGKYKRAKTHAKVIAVTGSVGKTSVKEALAYLLGKQGVCYSTTGNLNNHIGLPLTLANIPDAADFIVLEMGMNHAGEISYLTKLGRPNIAIITTVAAVHLEFFKSVEGIAFAKSEIFEGITEGGAAIIPEHNEYYKILRSQAEKCGVKNIVNFGKNWEVNYGEISAEILGEKFKYKISLAGDHNIINSVAVLSAIKLAGADATRAASEFAEIKPFNGRGNIITLKNGARIINDAYNASPESMKASIKTLSQFKNSGARLLVALGDMLELGDHSQKFHEELAEQLNNVDIVFTKGNLMKYLFDKISDHKNAKHFSEIEPLAEKILQTLSPNDVLLVKGSHGSGMWKLVELIASQKLKTGN
jgi:UDP-N-acetylmuramoyl-tripeptide--D-alanyl-D-alanine ligase